MLKSSTVTRVWQTRPRVRVKWGERRPHAYWKPKRKWRLHRVNQNGVFLPGKGSPLYPLVEECRAIPDEYWEKHQEPPIHVLTNEELAEAEHAKQFMEAKKQERVDRKAQIVEDTARREKELQALREKHKDAVASILAAEKQKELFRASRYY